MKKYTNEWDVHLREAYGEDTQVVRVESTNTPGVFNGFLYFQVAGDEATALFPTMNVAKVVRVEEALTGEGSSAQSDDVPLCTPAGRTGCGCA